MLKQLALTSLLVAGSVAGATAVSYPRTAGLPLSPVTINAPGINVPNVALVATTVLPQPALGSLSRPASATLTIPPTLLAQSLLQTTTKPDAPVTYSSSLKNTIIGQRAIARDGTSYPLRNYYATVIPNDPRASQPWVTSANLSSAWDTPRGSAQTLLAVIDTGFALQHQEFTNRWYTNTGESGLATAQNPSILNCSARSLPLLQSCNLIDDDGDGIVDNETGATTRQNPSLLNCTDQGKALNKSCNLIDDDNNGFIDDVRGWDFANNDRSVQAGQVNPNGAGTHHASYVTGVAAATGNNGVGIAGVDWGTTILPIQALDDDGAGNTTTVANAIDYAVARKANVINLSLGSSYDDPLVHEAVDRAIAAGITVVAAAGNDGCDCMLYPANYPEVLSVGALDPSTGQAASFSSYGNNLKLLAPGVNLYTTDFTATNPTSAYAAGISGTSLATPVVSGLITRLLSQQPQATPRQLMAALLENTNRTGLTAATPRTNSLGFGLLDAGKASLRMTTSYAPQMIYALRVSNGASLAIQLLESPDTAVSYQCDTGTTAVYALDKAGSSLFSSSAIEQQLATNNGYSATLFTYNCLTQPQDRPLLVRTINPLSEFRNLNNQK